MFIIIIVKYSYDDDDGYGCDDFQQQLFFGVEEPIKVGTSVIASEKVVGIRIYTRRFLVPKRPHIRYLVSSAALFCVC